VVTKEEYLQRLKDCLAPPTPPVTQESKAEEVRAFLNSLGLGPSDYAGRTMTGESRLLDLAREVAPVQFGIKTALSRENGKITNVYYVTKWYQEGANISLDKFVEAGADLGISAGGEMAFLLNPIHEGQQVRLRIERNGQQHICNAVITKVHTDFTFTANVSYGTLNFSDTYNRRDIV
jgi:hypothetical protein